MDMVERYAYVSSILFILTMKIASLAIIEQDGKILFGLKRGAEIGSGTLNGPGGKLDPGESIVDCVVRETKEELDIELDRATLEASGPAAIVTFYAAGIPDFEVHVFYTSSFVGEPKETESMIPEWHSKEALPYARMLESDAKWFPKILAGEKFRANVFYRERAKDFERIEFSAL
jgi:8-oxo-dGTP diphosphatase